MIFGKGSECVIYIAHSFVWNVYRSEKNSARYYQKYTSAFIWSATYSWY